MSNIVAGIGRGQLLVLKERVAQKKAIYERYEQAFKGLPIEMMNIADFGESNYWLSAATLKAESPVSPVEIMIELEKHNIESRPVWKPMHLQPVFAEYAFFTANEEGSISEDLFNRGICLPSDTKMTVEQQEKVIEIIKGMFT